MAKKKKDIVWHKKKSKFISSALTKSHHSKDEVNATQMKQDRKKRFIKSLAEKIKNAVQHSSE